MEYLEFQRPDGDALCSDNECPCGFPGTRIPRGTGYIYISQDVDDVFRTGVFAPILMCEQGVRRRGLDMEIAAADAKYWWSTGLVPIRPTPLAGSSTRIIEVEAESLEEAREQVKSQMPEGFYVLSEKVVSDGKPNTVKESAYTTELAFTRAQSKIPSSEVIMEKKEVIAPEWETITVEAFGYDNAILKARLQSQLGSEAKTRTVKLLTSGNKGFLGIGRKPNQYEVEVLRPAVVEVTYITKAKIIDKIVEKKEVQTTDSLQLFIETLDKHLQRMRMASPQLTSFLDQYFGVDNIALFARMASEKMRLTQSDGAGHSIGMSVQPVSYNVSTVPVEINQARDWFAQQYGGYIKYLENVRNNLVDFQLGLCSVFCHIIYGWTKNGTWVQVTVFPVKKPSPVDSTIIPIEFLTSEERRLLGLAAEEAAILLLSDMEKKVLVLLAAEMHNFDIAQRLGVSSSTTADIVLGLKSKFGVQTNAELIKVPQVAKLLQEAV